VPRSLEPSGGRGFLFRENKMKRYLAHVFVVLLLMVVGCAALPAIGKALLGPVTSLLVRSHHHEDESQEKEDSDSNDGEEVVEEETEDE